MNKVYVVTSGSYSDYSIDAVFSTKEKAQAYVDFINRGSHWDDAEIEEWDLDVGADKFAQGYRTYDVTIRRDGQVVEIGESWPTGSTSEVYYSEKTYNESWRDSTRFTIEATSPEQAVKIANERRTILLVTNQWGSKP